MIHNQCTHKYMRLRQKTLVVVCGTVIILLLATYFVSQNVLLSSFAELERQDTQKNAERAVSALNAEISSLSRLVHDWSAWDDTYAFVQNPNIAYMEANLGDNTFSHYKFNLIAYINSSGCLVYAKTFDLQNQTEVPVPQSFLESVSTSDLLWRFNDTEGHLDGILLLQEGPVLISSRPIITSNYEGPIVGSIILGRNLDSQEVSSLSEQVRLPLALQRFDDAQLPTDFQAAHSQLSDQKPILVKPLNSDDVAGYALLKDVYGTPSLMMRADMARDIFNQGLTSVSYVAFSFLAAGLTFTALLILLLEKLVLNRLAQLSKTIRQIGKSGELSRRVHIEGKDELSDLSCEFNNMLSTLEDTRNALKKHSEHLEELVEEKTNKLRQVERMAAIGELAGMVGHDLRNPLTGIAGAAYYLKVKYDSKFDGKGKEMLEIMEKDIAYSNKIISDLLDFSREIKLELAETTPKSMLKEAYSSLEIPQNIQVQDETDDKPRMRVDVSKMNRVFVNIIKNAFDAMPKGGVLVIRSEEIEKHVSFSFTDTGTGMSEEALGKLWTPLFTTKSKGMGFGLSICKRIVEAHGGAISVETTVGMGTTFRMSVPIEPRTEETKDVWVNLPETIQLKKEDNPRRVRI